MNGICTRATKHIVGNLWSLWNQSHVRYLFTSELLTSQYDHGEFHELSPQAFVAGEKKPDTNRDP